MTAIVRNFSSKILKHCKLRQNTVTIRSLATKDENEIDLDKPIKFSTSKAATWKAEHSFSGQEREDVSPWYQPIVVSLSLATFMVYFFILREESDIDQSLTRPLTEHVEGLEEVQLTVAINYYKENDKSFDTSTMEQRLAEIRKLKADKFR